MLGECAEFGARCIHFCMGAAARGTLSRPAARTPQLRHVAARLRPQAVRAASRSASHEQPMLGECAEFGARCIRFCMGAAARGTL